MNGRPRWRHQDLTERIIGAFYDVRNTLGYGFLESVYENALVHELGRREMRVIQQKPLAVYYDGVIVGQFFADLIVEDRVILELKAVEKLVAAHRRQLYNYLRATDCEVGLVLNFGPEAEFFRVILDNDRKPHHKLA
ncbi:MAG: GxxExxY protein [Anaerolineae bacterium]|nr:GxxExxY protein [Anaerolineae bacterium]